MGNAAKLRVMDVFERTVRLQGPKPALRVKRNGGWQTITWDTYHKQVRQVARALMAIGSPDCGNSCASIFCSMMALSWVTVLAAQ